MNANNDRFGKFRALHHADRPLFLPNAWDHASAAALAARGFSAIGTTSLGVAAAAGKPDAAGATREDTVRLARGLTRLPALISVDIEGGFSDHPDRVVELAVELAEAGVVGVNIEDGRPDGTLTARDRQCALITAIKDAVPGLFVNARTDVYWLRDGERPPPGAEDDAHPRGAGPASVRPAGVGPGGPSSGSVAVDRVLGAAMARARAYQDAGADGLFVPGVDDEHAIATLAEGLDAPLNILLTPGGPSFHRLADLGVRRVSCGSLLFRAAVHNAVELAWALAHEEVTVTGLPSYAEAQALAAAFDA
ncbi:isocitrate lyase/PEP mutase family protein [Sphaerisporangium perillae]|uniref:isocitrate lyase/PEP mutase family protein n=1 Tax=Sphaerisporangium perillae TaxID=2935860 RepID=UPI00200BC437|nr:isocitrate lyase/phosphoenolpyruvate mutase family protein [Sphaerisporangium perillae]